MTGRACALALALAAAGCGDRPAPPPSPPEASTVPMPEPARRRLLARMQELAQAGRFDEGIALGETALSDHPAAPELNYLLGMSFALSGQQPAARDCFRKELALQPDHVGSLLNLGASLVLVGRASEAAAPLGRAVELEPNLPQSRDMLARALVETGRQREAEPHLAALIRLAPTADAHARIARLKGQLGELEQAADAYRAGLALEPEHEACLFGLGRVLLLLGRDEEGRALLDRHAALAIVRDREDEVRRARAGDTAGGG